MPFLTAKSLISAPLLAAIVVVAAAATRTGEHRPVEHRLEIPPPLDALIDTAGNNADLSVRITTTARELDGPARVRYLRTVFEEFPQIEGDLDLALLYLQSAIGEGSIEDERVARDFVTANRQWRGDTSALAAPKGAPRGA